MKLIQYYFLFWLLLFSLFGSAQKISNIYFEQADKQIHIYYDLVGDGSYTVQVFCSTDNGQSWGELLKHVSGAVGENQIPGKDKKIGWDVLKEREELLGEILFKVEVLKKMNLKNGKAIYDETCISCHWKGIDGAPALNDKTRWEEIAAKCMKIIHLHSVIGYEGDYGFMPEKGTCVDCSTNDVYDAIGYMFNQSGVTVEQPEICDQKKQLWIWDIKDEDSLKGFYENLLKTDRIQEYHLGNWEHFSSYFSDSTKIKEFYSHLINDEIFSETEIGDWKAFSTNMQDVINAHRNMRKTRVFIDRRDGQTYKWIKIGNQVWMSENLNYKTNNGSWCYNNNNSNCYKYGRLYTWHVALIVCPNGWHLPSDEEWKTLEIYLGMSQSGADDTGWRGTDEGKEMKSTTGWNSNENDTNRSGFNALPGDYRHSSGSFLGLEPGYHGYWWLDTEFSGTNAWRRSLRSGEDRVRRDRSGKEDGFSVRCVRD